MSDDGWGDTPKTVPTPTVGAGDSGFADYQKPAAPASGGFGASKSGFGNAGSGFGSAAAPAGFGGAPAKSAAPVAASGFGGTSSGFGGASAASSGFGSGSKPATAPASGFGNGPAKSGFGGAPSGASGFGGAPTASSGFAGAAPARSGFGGAPSARSGFGGAPKSGNAGAPTSASGFGGGAPAAAKSGFGGAPAASPGFGGGAAPSGFGGGASSGFGGSGAPSGFGGGAAPSGFGGGAAASGFGGGGAAASGFGGGGAAFGGSGGGFGGADAGERPRGCFNCGQEGHRSAECTEPRKERGPMVCRNCNEEGHKAMECPQPRAPRDDMTCYNCGNPGHMSAECPEPKVPKGACHNCGTEGHFTRDCPEPMNPDRKPASTHIPVDIDDETLFAEQKIQSGEQFNRFFDSKINVTQGGNAVPDFKKISTFEEVNLTMNVAQNVARAGYKTPTPIQQVTIPMVMSGSDMMACAQTGSGKTAAFLLPIMSKLIESGDLSNSGESACCPRCIVLAPTRELAIQIQSEARKFAHGTVFKTEVVYGGTSVAFQRSRCQTGATIIVATTGRLKHFIDEGIISLANLRYLVLDEADRMLDMGFLDEIECILKNAPPREQRQSLMFSATFPDDVQTLAKNHLRDDYYMIAVDNIGSANKCITQEFVEIGERREKKDKLLEMLNVDLNTYSTTKDNDIYKKKTLIFVGKKSFADTLATILSEASIPATTIHGDRMQGQREEALRDFRTGRKPVLIATAVAERGLDISGVDHVINYDMPDNIADYVHRIGRTGRVGNVGRATSLFYAEHDNGLSGDLVKVLSEAEQIVPEWLANLSGGCYTNGGGAGGAGGDDGVW